MNAGAFLRQPVLEPGSPDLNDGPLVIEQGDLLLRLAESAEDIAAVQALRFRVFYTELQAAPSDEMAQTGLDFDRYDGECDHLMVIDRSRPWPESVVGTYRLIRSEVAERLGGFYSASEYDISPLLAMNGRLLELGRSCVELPYRNRPTLQLLWRGIGAYLTRNDIALMFGCASFLGHDPSVHAEGLSYLYHNHLADPELRARALPARYSEMNLRAPETLNIRRAFAGLPPLLKGYLRLGAMIGDGAVVDLQFDTVDVLIIVPVARMTGRYARHFVGDANI